MVLYPIPETALMLNLKAWLAIRDEAWLSDWAIATSWPISRDDMPDRLIVISAGTAADRQIVDAGMLTITILGPAADYESTIQAAQYLKAALPGLTGNGIAALSRVKGPTPASDVTGRPKRILSVDFVTTAALV